MVKFGHLTAASVAAGLLAATAAGATTKDFSYSLQGTTVASGSFSYATGDTGVLGYGDLTSFSLNVAGATYDLAQVDTLTDYVWFGYDTAGNDFVTNPDTCGFAGCGYGSSLSAINSSGSYGFFFTPVSEGAYEEYSTPASGAFDAITITNAVPEPATWSMMILGIGGAGLALRRARKTVALA